MRIAAVFNCREHVSIEPGASFTNPAQRMLKDIKFGDGSDGLNDLNCLNGLNNRSFHLPTHLFTGVNFCLPSNMSANGRRI
jgi:hypothetical protein